MSSTATTQESVNDLWARAAVQLSDIDKQNINFNRSDKLNILAELHSDAERVKQKSIKSKWKYTRKSGETVIIRDVLEKIVRWIDTFKQIGDIAVQYDPAHATLPWAGVRLVLQIAVSDINKYASVVEGLARIAELICRYRVTEALYLQNASKATEQLESALVKLYASTLGYLSKAKQYLEQRSAARVIKSVFVIETQLESGLNDIRVAENDVDRCTALVDRNDRIKNYARLIDLQNRIEQPLRRMNDDLKSIGDNLKTSKRTKIIQWLSPEPYMQHHKQAKQGVLEGTGQWLLSDPEFKRWKDESASSILWLHGIPGSGKSKLVSIAIDDAFRRFEADDSPQPVFFYCSQNPVEPARSDPAAVLASLARQLSCLKPGKPLLRPTIDLYSKEEEEGFASGPLQLNESRDLVLQLVEQYPQTTIMIDAMDECDPSKRPKLLEALEQILRDSTSLIKIFISSRNDQDIVLRLGCYPNLEITSQKNGDDIAKFVETQTELLIRDRKLLHHSISLAEMKELIIREVIQGAAGMFRWASMELQYLCAFRLDADIRNSLGRLPPDLYTLYAKLYEMLSTKPGDLEAGIFKNTLQWLLCARRKLTTEEFLSAVSMNPTSADVSEPVSKDLILEICNNFVVFDSQLETFRFAHLSVREFLEQRTEHDKATANCLAAEVCLRTILSNNPNAATANLLMELGWHATALPSISEKFLLYADVYWATHCESAKQKRSSGRLNKALRHMLSDYGETSSITLWKYRLPTNRVWLDDLDDWERLKTASRGPESTLSLGLSICRVYDFDEQTERTEETLVSATSGMYLQNESLLDSLARNSSRATLDSSIDDDNSGPGATKEAVEATVTSRAVQQIIEALLDQQGTDVNIQENVVKAAAESNKEVMEIILDRKGTDVQITEEVLMAAASNERNGKGVMEALLNKRGADVHITEEVVKTAAGNWRNGKEVIQLLLNRSGADAYITEEVVKTAAGNPMQGNGVLELLLNCGGADVCITEELVSAVGVSRLEGTEVMRLLLYRRGADVHMTQETVEAIVAKFDEKIVALLLSQQGAKVRITKEVVRAAAGNESYGKEVIELLLNWQGANIYITEDVVKAAVGNRWSGKGIMGLLINWPGADAYITEEVVKMVAQENCKEMMELLLNQPGADAYITEEVVKMVAQENCKEMMELLLNQPGADAYITEEVVRIVVRKDKKEMMELLLNRPGADACITEEVVKIVVRWDSKEIMELLLNQPGADAYITEEVVKMVAQENCKEMMELLLNQPGADAYITEEVVKMVAQENCKEMMELLLNQPGADAYITEEVVKMVVQWVRKDMIELLLDRPGADAYITEEVVETAVESWRFSRDLWKDVYMTKGALKRTAALKEENSKAVLKFLLSRLGADIYIAVVKTTAGDWRTCREEIEFLLDQQGADVQITEEVVKAAAANEEKGREVMEVLFDRRGNEVEVTKEVVRIATWNPGQGNQILELLRKKGGHSVDVYLSELDESSEPTWLQYNRWEDYDGGREHNSLLVNHSEEEYDSWETCDSEGE